jgi:pyruvate,water dikinase
VSPGAYEGTARVVLDESELDRIEPGDVLVCPITSPVWSMVFPALGALVCDSGGPLSHPAIIAREFAIPAVVNTGNATSVIPDGATVRVDGDRGSVSVL